MIKKIFMLIFLSLLIASCGKKSDPIYNGNILNIFNTELAVVV
tara:strand:+ start:288 stop:416 length:129 start_codon:yes stop_codon:yes gene_type:complete